MRVLSATGIQGEAELPFAGLHQALMPVLDAVDTLPVRQRKALRTAFGLADEATPDLFLVGLATLSLLTDLASETPVVLLADDVQWLDVPTADVLTFVGRRLGSDPVALLAAVREGLPSPLLRGGLRELRLGPLDDPAAEELLDRHSPDLPSPVRQRLLAEAAGNPLALVELPDALSADERQGACDVAGPPPPERAPRARVRGTHLSAAGSDATAPAGRHRERVGRDRRDRRRRGYDRRRDLGGQPRPCDRCGPRPGRRRRPHVPPPTGAFGPLPVGHERRTTNGAHRPRHGPHRLARSESVAPRRRSPRFGRSRGTRARRSRGPRARPRRPFRRCHCAGACGLAERGLRRSWPATSARGPDRVRARTPGSRPPPAGQRRPSRADDARAGAHGVGWPELHGWRLCRSGDGRPVAARGR